MKEFLTDRQLLLLGILQNPDDDAPRFIYSDCLEESGEYEFAKAIRAMCKKHNRRIFLHDNSFFICGGMKAKWFKEWALNIKKSYPQVELIHRGFPCQIKLTCDEFIGIECKACRGRGVVVTTLSDGIYQECKNCNGEGKVGDVAKSLFQLFPITRVVLTDKDPVGLHYVDELACGRKRSHTIPREIFELIESSESDGFASFRSVSDAANQLSSACVKFGRRKAGIDRE